MVIISSFNALTAPIKAELVSYGDLIQLKNLKFVLR